MRIDVITIFGDYLAPLRLSLVGRAIADGVIDLHVHDLRQFTHDRHRTVDDSPYGGGPGMVMKPEPWGAALRAVLAEADPGGPSSAGDGDGDGGAGGDGAGDGGAGAGDGAGDGGEGGPVRIVVPTPSGRRFTQPTANQWANDSRLIFACGRYEGIDARVVPWARTLEAGRVPVEVEEVSIGDYVLAGAEAAVLVMVEAVARLIPGVLGNADSPADDSFAPGAMADLLEGPIYTRPPVWEGMAVPDVLTSGDHAAVAAWRRQQARDRTNRMRPDLPT